MKGTHNFIAAPLHKMRVAFNVKRVLFCFLLFCIGCVQKPFHAFNEILFTSSYLQQEQHYKAMKMGHSLLNSAQVDSLFLEPKDLDQKFSVHYIRFTNTSSTEYVVRFLNKNIPHRGKVKKYFDIPEKDSFKANVALASLPVVFTAWSVRHAPGPLALAMILCSLPVSLLAFAASSLALTGYSAYCRRSNTGKNGYYRLLNDHAILSQQSVDSSDLYGILPLVVGPFSSRHTIVFLERQKGEDLVLSISCPDTAGQNITFTADSFE